MRRIKDVIDLYILSYIWKGDINLVYNYMSSSGKDLGDFDCMLNKYSELEHAYSRYRNKASILPFDIVYKRVLFFIEPFIKGIGGVYWSGDKWC